MKHISCIDSVDSLRSWVRHELREIGIKVPKPKKSKRGAHKGSQQDIHHSAPVFGTCLAQVHCVHIEGCGYVAKFLVDAAKIIQNHIDSEGIFRKTGAVSRQKEIKQQVENGHSFKDANVHDVATLVKQFFRELPEPLFTSTYHDTFVRCYQLDDPQLSTRAILLLCLLLPVENISTLRYTMQLLARVAKVSGNKMDPTNLAVVLVPNIMHINNKSDKMKSWQSEEKLLQIQTSVVELLIVNADLVGMVEEDIVAHAALLTEVMSTDDELDASEDNLEDSKEPRKKDKKRKRSGSFQGFVSSIAQSITKWRRSTDGKTNTSGISHGSNTSHLSTFDPQHAVSFSGQAGPSTQGKENQPDEGSTRPPVHQFSATDVTPMVHRRKQAPNTEGRAFSASKKKAILNQLPQHSTLASTPFTPSLNMKKMNLNSGRRGLDTPSMPPRPYHGTPAQSAKGLRKKLSLFSPASTTKKRRHSTSKLPHQLPNKKGQKSKGIFRRLSGSKGDQGFPSSTSAKGSSCQQIGQRLASPTSSIDTSTHNASGRNAKSNSSILDESPIAAIVQSSSFSSSVCEQSVISNDDESRSLNDGFIISDDKEVDISRIMSEPALSGSVEAGEYISLEDIHPRNSLSDTTLNQSNFETSNGHSRSYSVDSILENSSRKAGLRRGQPNSIKAGLLHGDQKEVQKLRRSFGMDQSGYQMAESFVNVAEAKSVSVESLDDSFDCLSSNNHGEQNLIQDHCGETVCVAVVGSKGSDSPGSVSQCKENREVNPSINILDESLDKSKEKDSVSLGGYSSDNESESGFSTISGGTAVFLPQKLFKNRLGEGAECVVGISGEKDRVLQKQESKDSLLSQGSSTGETSFSSASSLNTVAGSLCGSVEREMVRSVSADSGKGSLCEESIDTVDPEEVHGGYSATGQKNDSDVTSTEMNESKLQLDGTEGRVVAATCLSGTKSASAQDLMTEFNTTIPQVSRSKSMLDKSLATRKNNVKPNLQISEETHKLLTRAVVIKPSYSNKKSASTQDIKTECNTTPAQVSRSKSLLDKSMGTRRNNGKPNLQISSETHKLLARAGYIRDQSNEASEKFDDFVVPGIIDREQHLTKVTDDGKDSTSAVSPEHNEKTLEELNEEFDSFAVQGTTAFSLIKQADLLNPRRESIIALRKNNAGFVKTNIQQFNKITGEEREIEMRHNSPFRFHNSSMRRGVSPLKIPSVFSTKENDGEKCGVPTVTNAPVQKVSIELLKVPRSPGSPVKPLKRLRSSPHSPRCKALHSPKSVQSKQLRHLSAISNQNDDLNNL